VPRMTGAQLFAEMMEGYEVSHIFFVPAFMLKAFAEMEDRPIRRVMVHGKKAAAYMADGYAASASPRSSPHLWCRACRRWRNRASPTSK